MQTYAAQPGALEAGAFLEWLSGWQAGLQDTSIYDIARSAGGEARVGVFCVDMTNGFCCEGPLASPRVEGIIRPVVELLERAHKAGVRTFILPQDAHPADSPEFSSWPAHCIAGTSEAETIAQIRNLPFAGEFTVVEKFSTNPAPNTTFDMAFRLSGVRAAICVGDCTDLCVYQLAMHLRTEANARGEKLDVIVPAECVQTYDISVEASRELGAMPHPGDLLHAVFLYHLALNGVRIVRSITA